ncbi:MAG: PIN domain-containing protein [Dermatophilus congolensis]|nr:PIN domain-containing protein [Dermatophilus congolensis]
MTTYLLDANALIALLVQDHEHHTRVVEWFQGVETFAVCPVVEGAFVRFLLRLGESAETAQSMVQALKEHERCSFWPDMISYADCDMTGVRGHRQVTDVYLAELARAHGDLVATFDKALSELRPRSTFLIP